MIENNHTPPLKEEKISDLIRQDLLNVARSLPKTEDNHEDLILLYYKIGGWHLVDIYVDGVHQRVNPKKTQNKALRDTIYQFWDSCMVWIENKLEELRKWLNR